jgi:hypothetical protein
MDELTLVDTEIGKITHSRDEQVEKIDIEERNAMELYVFDVISEVTD